MSSSLRRARCVPGALALLACAASADVDPPLSVDYPTGNRPYSVVRADLNGDGLFDLAVCSRVSDDVSVLLGKGSGGFDPAVMYGVGNGPEFLAVGLIDGDGLLDLVTANRVEDSVTVLLGNGDGTFQPALSHATGDGPVSVDIGDLDEDGWADLVVANELSDDVSVLFGNGDGTFAPKVDSVAGDGPRWVEIVDADEDGALDVLVALLVDDGIAVLPWLGGGALGVPVSAPAGKGPRSLAAADFDADGNVDVATANVNSDDVSVLRGLGNLGFLPAATVDAGNGPTAIYAADVDLDGMLDAVSVNRLDHGVAILRGAGDGTVAPFDEFESQSLPRSAAVGDLNADGWPDIAVADSNDSSSSYPGDTSIHFGQGAGNFHLLNYPAGSGAGDMVMGDLDGDGAPDLVTLGETTDDVQVLMGRSDGTFEALPAPTLVGDRPRSLDLADFDGDGNLDLVTSNWDSDDLSVCAGLGDGTFGPPSSLGVGNQPYHFDVGDVDQDGALDIVVAVYGMDVVSVHIGNGDGTFEGAYYLLVPAENPIDVAIVEVDGDPFVDLAVASGDPGCRLFRGVGGGKFVPAEFVYTGGGGGQNFVSSADLDLDGIQDLIFIINKSIRIVPGAAGGTFESPIDVPVGGYPRTVTIDDFDQDGVPDFVAGGVGTDAVYFFSGNGDMTFDAWVDFEAGDRPRSEVVHDFDGNGERDVAVFNEYGSSVTVVLRPSSDVPSLCASPVVLSASAGGVQSFTFAPGPAFAGSFYLMLGSAGGTSPGLPIGLHVLPLNVDAYFSHTLTNPNGPPLQNSFGALDGTGQASGLAFTLPPGLLALVGMQVHHACLVIAPTGAMFQMTSNAAALDVVP